MLFLELFANHQVIYAVSMGHWDAFTLSISHIRSPFFPLYFTVPIMLIRGI